MSSDLEYALRVAAGLHPWEGETPCRTTAIAALQILGPEVKRLQAIVDTLPLDGDGNRLTPGCERMDEGQRVIVKSIHAGFDNLLVGNQIDKVWWTAPGKLTAIPEDTRSPKLVELLDDVQSDIPCLAVPLSVRCGETVEVRVNSHGAVSACLPGGQLGLKPAEYRVVEWYDAEVKS